MILGNEFTGRLAPALCWSAFYPVRMAGTGIRTFFVLGLAVVVALASVSCSGVDAPRRSTAAFTGEATAFESPRKQFVVEAKPDIGNVSLRGVVQGRNPIEVFAPENGRVLEVFFFGGDIVTAGDAVLRFLPDPSEAELLSLEIAELIVARAVAGEESAAMISEAELARDDLAASFADRVVTISSPASGVINAARRTIAYDVSEGARLFAISDASDLVVVLPLETADLASVQVGTTVSMMRPADLRAPAIIGVVAEIPEPNGTLQPVTNVLIELSSPDEVALGERLTAALRITADGDDARWVRLEAVGRSGGASFVLISNGDGDLRRLAVGLGRRTRTHVQVLSGLTVGDVLVAP